MDARLSLKRGGWYGMTMLPGYGNGPYSTPIRVDNLTPRGNRKFELIFLNLGYAAGVQNFSSTFRTLKRGAEFIIAEQEGTPDRGYIFQNLTPDWLDRNIGPGSGKHFLHDNGSPNEQHLLNAAATSY